MDQQSVFFSILVAICATVLMLMSIQFFIKKFNIKYEKDNKTSLSFSILMSSILIIFFMYLKVALELIENSIELLIYSKTDENTFLAVMQKIATFVGFTFLFTFLSYYIVHKVFNLTFGNRIDSIEIERENTGYFLIKGFVLILLVFSFISIFEHFLRWFAPVIDTPFYH